MGTYEDYSSYFIREKALFGGFPTQEQAIQLSKLGVCYFVDLTFPEEVKNKYFIDDMMYINFPIVDRKVPFEIGKFASLVLMVSKTIDNLKLGERIYIHCKGGHGRSGLLVAALICLREKIHIDLAVQKTTEFHNERKIMRQKWRELGSPQTKSQKSFLFKFFRNLYFFRSYKKGTSAGFSNYSAHMVTLGEGNKLIPPGTYFSSEAAFQASKNPMNKEFTVRLQNVKNPRMSRTLGDRERGTDTWFENRIMIMRVILIAKINQNPEIATTLMRTGLRTIIYNSRTDDFFGIGGSEDGDNHMGEILMEIRNFYYSKLDIIFKHCLKDTEEEINGEEKTLDSSI